MPEFRRDEAAAGELAEFHVLEKARYFNEFSFIVKLVEKRRERGVEFTCSKACAPRSLTRVSHRVAGGVWAAGGRRSRTRGVAGGKPRERSEPRPSKEGQGIREANALAFFSMYAVNYSEINLKTVKGFGVKSLEAWEFQASLSPVFNSFHYIYAERTYDSYIELSHSWLYKNVSL